MLLPALILIAAAEVPPTLRLPEGAKPTHYAVDLTVDPAATKLNGAIDIDLEITKPTATLWLNATDITIDKSAAYTVIAGGKDFIGLQMKAPLMPGKQRVHIAYSAPYQLKDSSGASKQKEAGDWYIFTHFEPIDARRVFPCFDEPGYKVPWQITLRVPPKLSAFSNTATTEEKVEGKLKRFTFAETKPLPSYLIAFAVGPIDVVDGGATKRSKTPVRILVPKGQGASAAWAAESSRQALDHLEDYFDSDYPYGKMDVIAVPLFGGAMEHPGLVTFSSNLALQRPGTETLALKRAYAEVAVHEFAHQWFGDLVTMAWWDDLWLNEAFATWLTPKIIDVWQPSWGAAEDRVRTRAQAMGSDSLISARKIRQPILDTGDVSNAFDGITYGKGATVIATFERFVAPDVFRRGVQRYMSEHAHGNATAAQFLGAISVEAKRDIAPAFSTFLDQAGVPSVSFELQCEKAARLKLSQQRYLPLGTPGGGENQIWQIPICVRTPKGTTCSLFAGRDGEVALGTTCPEWVVAVEGGAAYYRAYPKGPLANRLQLGALDHMSAAERLGFASDLVALVRSGKLDMTTILELAPKLGADSNRFVVETASMSVGWLKQSTLVGESERTAYARYIEDAFGARAHKLGWTENPSDDEDTRLLRTHLLPIVTLAGEDAVLTEEAERLARLWLGDHKAVAPNVVDGVLTIASRHGDAAYFEKVLAAAKAEKDRAKQRHLLRALASFRDPALVKRALALLLTDTFDAREASRILWGMSDEPGAARIAWEWVQANFDTYVKKLPRDSGGYLPYVASSICDPEVITQVKGFFAERSKAFEGGPRELDQALEQMQLCAAYRAAQRPVVARFFSGAAK